MSDTLQQKYDEYRNRYNSNCQGWRSEPVMQRKVNDPVCIVFLLIVTVFFFGVGIYYITSVDDLPQGTDDNNTVFQEFIGPIIGCVILSLVVSVAYIVLIKLFPKIMIIAMTALSLALIAILCIIGIAIENFLLAIVFGLMLLIYVAIIFCFKDRIRMGITLVKVATKFISDRPVVFLTPIIKVVLVFLFALFWIYSISCIFLKANNQAAMNQDTSTANFFSGIWVLLWLFYTFFFYYLMVFTIAVTCAFWYYNVQGKNSIITAYKWIYGSAIGSITFAAMVIAIITFIRMIVDTKRRNTRNIASAVCFCLLSCILKTIEALLKILNNNTIICMAVTGESYIESAKTTIGILCSDLPLFTISRLISNLLVFWGIILSVGIPTVIGYVWVDSYPKGADSLGSALLIIIFASIMLSGMIYSVLVESVSSVFIFYCFDRRFKELGYESHNMPNEIQVALGNAQSKANDSYAKLEDQK